MQWVVGGAGGALFTAIGLLIWRLVKLGVDQEDRLLTPCYQRVARLEARNESLERVARRRESQLGIATFLLNSHGIDVPWES